MKVLQKPLEVVTVRRNGNEAKILRFVSKENYAQSFGYEWSRYRATYLDSALGVALSKTRLEFLLGFPVEFLKAMRVLEIGCGAGRFTEHLVRLAKEVVAVDLSDAVYHNAALGAPNLIALQADLMNLPPLSQPIDLVFCRGVIQHTPDPVRSIQKLFDYARPGGLVIFDVYLKSGPTWRAFKYFWRPFIKKIAINKFDGFLEWHGRRLYRLQHALLRIYNRNRLTRFISYRTIAKTPFFLATNWDKQYPALTPEQRLAIFKNELIDMFYSRYDNPMSPQEVIEALAAIGQIPYSYDVSRNHYRCRKESTRGPLKVRMTKNGVQIIKP